MIARPLGRQLADLGQRMGGLERRQDAFDLAAQPEGRQRFVVAQPNTDEFSPSGSGVHVAGLLEDATDAALTESPGHPLADENGRVQMPVVDLAGQLTDLMAAQRGYQANSRAINSAREAYASALRIGNG